MELDISIGCHSCTVEIDPAIGRPGSARVVVGEHKAEGRGWRSDCMAIRALRLADGPFLRLGSCRWAVQWMEDCLQTY
jgi:hypothetical protein